jgi:GTP-binding protein
MKKIPFSQVEFITSAMDRLPTLTTESGDLFPEIAIVGKSNVGKSSLINHLLRQKIARVSSTPGRTQTINFFDVDGRLAVVDLPGYGFAKVSKEMRMKWATTMENYFINRKTLSLLLLLIDSRRDPSPEDLSFLAWADQRKLPYLVIFTKADTVSQKKLHGFSSDDCLHYSVKDLKCRKTLIDRINKKMSWD